MVVCRFTRLPANREIVRSSVNFKWIMENSRRRGLSDAESTKMLDQILEEDKEAQDEETSIPCPSYTEKRVCDCMRIAEHSSRFSLRVMEAMRSLQQAEDAFLPSCTVEDIVGYIVENYRDDGDLCAQVRTALKQVCSQGLVLRQPKRRNNTEHSTRCRRKCVSRETRSRFKATANRLSHSKTPCIYRPISACGSPC
ncbi:uncharacterized protein LOC143219106 [Lasioglossum baleicum]|uniref:uncharacterized protein LOC143219106 n=1 Tax=Lasioglossum baleicum TaxID=434251 RepID=UPI003FCE1953